MKEFGKKQFAAYGLGAVGKDMVYALSASYIMYYYQDILGLSATFVGFILMIARVFDAANDPFMGVVVAKTNSRWGKFRPWLFTGTILNAFVLYALFAAPAVSGKALMIYFAVMYILWGVTYTMMDIPFWSMIPAVTSTAKDRENLSVVGRTSAGVGYALINVFTVMAVSKLGGGIERTGFRLFALIIAILFVIFILFTCFTIREQKEENMQTTSVKEMFKALFNNDQAIVTVVTIVLINSALYITSNLLIYFFKYDIGGTTWKDAYTLFTSVGGISQILGMMAVYPILRSKLSNTIIFKLGLCLAIFGYAFLLALCLLGYSSVLTMLMVPGVMIFVANGILTVLTTVFLANTVDYGEVKTGHREESVIFSMQTFVVKAASGLAVFITGVSLDLIGLTSKDGLGEGMPTFSSPLLGLRLLMTILPMIGLVLALVLFTRKFILTDEKAEQIRKQLEEKKV
ncbi:glycoside-pentoside-hexuronide (GPH):cation symporter [uncultured Solobacterium sp.]|uniref:glycoside-pentoside-hexuronide (GPH):cation symporter n=1 Tax=uncultured Solobacterium sp. TaxID=747375 RepID=UPI001CABBE3D|nr:glycoside-pentoside-hexuronide (GPH):cation symporter [uncultured Solobacterium sp.]MBF1073011.1 MFS transporter [Solobacterium sp.]